MSDVNTNNINTNNQNKSVDEADNDPFEATKQLPASPPPPPLSAPALPAATTQRKLVRPILKPPARTRSKKPPAPGAAATSLVQSEHDLKREYYMSEPLRSYGQLRGESILPSRLKRQLLVDCSGADSNDSPLVANPTLLPTRRAKSLPKAFAELRSTSETTTNQTAANANTNSSEDRSIYKQKLRTELQLSSHLDEIEFLRSFYPKSQPEMLENSKRVYTEMSRANVTKPIDVDNVESVLKRTVFATSPTKSSCFRVSFYFVFN